MRKQIEIKMDTITVHQLLDIDKLTIKLTMKNEF